MSAIRHRVARAASVLAGGIVVAALVGCGAAGPDPEAADSLVVIVGAHQGAVAPGLPQELQSSIEAAIAARAPIAVVVSDGTPAVSASIAGYPISSENDDARRLDVQTVTRQLIAAVAAAVPDTEGNDLGAALAVAADQVRSAGAQHPLVVVVDSGVSDRGFPNVTGAGTMTTDPEEVVRFGGEHGYLPSFPSGTVVQLVGIGYGAAPQPDLTPPQRDHLVALWSSVARAGGASVEVIPTPRSGEGLVTTLPSGILQPGGYLELPAGSPGSAALPGDVLFESGSPTLRDTPETRAALAELARFVAAQSGGVVIAGHTDAVGDPDANLALSIERAQAVNDAIVGSVGGVALTVCGYGETRPAVPDATTPEELQQNRRVTVSAGDSC